MSVSKRLFAEFLGTFWLVFGGCGSAVLAASFPEVGIGLTGVSIAFGLTVLTMAYALGHISGGHFNPAVSVGLMVGRPVQRPRPRTVCHCAGGGCASSRRACSISSPAARRASVSRTAWRPTATATIRPEATRWLSALVIEVVLTFGFLIVILGATDKRAPAGFGPLAIGLSLTLIHLISIPVTNTSVNPARSTGPALFVGDWALSQLWLFWVAPIVGAALAGAVYRWLGSERQS